MNRAGAGQRVGAAAAVVVLALAAAVGVGDWLRADDKPDAKKDKDIGKELIGTWALAGTPDKPEEPREKGGRLKFFGGKHWTITQYDPDTGEVVFHHGGTYTLDGENYAETIEYANPNTAELIGKTLKFKVKVDKDTYTQVGDGNPYTEAWRRAK